MSKTINTEGYYKIQGTISELVIERARTDVLGMGSYRSAAIGTNVLTSVADVAQPAQMSSNDLEEDVDHYRFMLDGKLFKGRCHIADFKEGDQVEVVYQYMEDWKGERDYFAICVYNPVSKRIWPRPYQERGTTAEWRQKASMMGRMCAIFMFITAIFVSVVFWWVNDTPVNRSLSFFNPYLMIIIVGLVCFILFFLMSMWFARIYVKLTYEANIVFSVLGFNDPLHINLHQTSWQGRDAFIAGQLAKGNQHYDYVNLFRTFWFDEAERARKHPKRMPDGFKRPNM